MSIRSDHRTALKTLLETITYNSANIAVSDYYITASDNSPYFYITAGDLTPNFGEGTLLATQFNYIRGYKYYINAVFYVPEGDSKSVETIIDDVEELLIDKLQSQSARDYGIWQDLVVNSVSSPYQRDPDTTDNYLIKTFEITIETNINNPT